MEVFISICGIPHKNNECGLGARRLTGVLCLLQEREREREREGERESIHLYFASAQRGRAWRSADVSRAPG